MEQCKCGYVKIWCPFHGSNRDEGLQELIQSTSDAIDKEIESLMKKKNELLKLKK